MQCSTCRTENADRAKFCTECGGRLATLRKAARAERRQITVLFCDLVGSTVLSEELDPEDLREVIQQYQSACAAVVARAGGEIAQYLGDGVLVYFGYPIAHEDDARRAVRAGLELQAAISRLSANGRPLQTRIGIHSGLVVVGELGPEGRGTQLALGETPNLAARVQQDAAPGSVLVSETTQRLVSGYFRWEDLGPRLMRGLRQPVRLYRVEGESGAQSRMEAASPSGLTPFVGRREEVQALLAGWGAARHGPGPVVTIRGEAGIGKSRMIEELKTEITHPLEIAECRCTPYQTSTALFPFVDLLERRLEFRKAGSTEEKLARLEAALKRSGPHLPEALALIAGMMSLPVGSSVPELQLSPNRRRQLTLETISRWFRNLAGKRRLLFIMEDLHWADPTTLEVLAELVTHDPVPGLMVVLTFRPELRIDWKAGEQAVDLDLRPLPQHDVRTMVNYVASRKSMPAEVTSLIAARTGGVPLFIEEVTKAVIETGVLQARENSYELTGPLPAGLIPATVQASLAARIDRVGSAKPIAQLAAVVGREFSYELLKAVSGLDDNQLQQALQRLQDAEIVTVEGEFPNALYTFKHALIQDAAYESILKKTRQKFHGEIVQNLETKFPEISQTQPELMAHHCQNAGLTGQALEYWGRAIERNKVRAANKETISHVGRAIDLLGTMPATPERWQRELGLQLALGPALTAMKGWSSPEVRQTYTRARDLCRELGDGPEIFPVLWGLWSFYMVSADHLPGLELAEKVYEAVEKSGDPVRLIPGLHAIGYSLYFTARYQEMLEVSRKGIGLYQPETERTIFSQFQIASSSALCDHAGTALWALGYPDQALAMADRSAQISAALGNRTALVWSMAMTAWGVPRLLRDTRRVREAAEEAIRLSKEEEFSFWPPLMRVFQGWALSEEGAEPAKAAAQMRAGFDQYRAVGGGVLGTSCLVHIADAHLKAGQHQQGLATVAEALEFVGLSGERHFEPEVFRVQGDLLRSQAEQEGRGDGALAEAEASFHRSLELSRSLKARSFELRAATGLARLWQKQSRRQEAVRLLGDVYGSFTEGFGTPDLREARSLLDQLGQA